MNCFEEKELIVVAGGGGFIGGHLVAELLSRGFKNIRAVDIRPKDTWYQMHPGVENMELDLSQKAACAVACDGAALVINLACDMGGMGFIETHKAECMLSVLINTHLIIAARDAGARRYFFSSSACVYNASKQDRPDVTSLKETDAYPAMPEDGYGWEKLFSERMCRHFMEDFGLQTRVGRYHNVYGPNGTFDGGREKAPAAICRKVITAKLTGKHEIEIWGDGNQTRSFLDVRDCVEGTLLLIDSDVAEPINIGSEQLVTINQLVDIVEGFADIKLVRRYNLDAPKGVRGRNSDNAMVQKSLGWSPAFRLEDGLLDTYRWIYEQVSQGYSNR